MKNKELIAGRAMTEDTAVLRSGEVGGVPWEVLGVEGAYRWRIRTPSDPNGAWYWEYSQGAFYDGVPEHPEGAIEWAASAAIAKLTRALLA